MSLVTSSPTNQGRTTKPRPARQSGSLSGRPQTSRRRLAMTRQAVGEISMPITVHEFTREDGELISFFLVACACRCCFETRYAAIHKSSSTTKAGFHSCMQVISQIQPQCCEDRDKNRNSNFDFVESPRACNRDIIFMKHLVSTEYDFYALVWIQPLNCDVVIVVSFHTFDNLRDIAPADQSHRTCVLRVCHADSDTVNWFGMRVGHR
jgi:hypothetical protein